MGPVNQVMDAETSDGPMENASVQETDKIRTLLVPGVIIKTLHLQTL